MTVVLSRALDVFADGQVLVLDGGTGTFDLVGQEQMLLDLDPRGVAILDRDPHRLMVGTARALVVPVDVEVRDDPPVDDVSGSDAVFESSIDVRGDRLAVYGTTLPGGIVPGVGDVAAGTHRVRVVITGWRTVDEDGIEGDDRYRFVLWPTDTPGDLGDRGPRVRQAPPQ